MKVKKNKQNGHVGTKHEFTDLVVDEISVVDVPANMQEFAVIKSKKVKEEKMAVETSTGENVSKTEKEVVSTEKVEDKPAIKIDGVLEQLNSIEKAVKDLTTANENEAESGVGNSEQIDEVSEFRKMLEDSGLDGEKLETAVKKFQEASEKKVEKAVEEPKTSSEIPEQLSSLIPFAEALKAKTVTPGRLSSIKQAQEILAKLLSEVEVIPQGNSPKLKSPANNEFGPSGLDNVMKALNQVTENLTSLTDTIKKNSEKIEKIEKTHLPSTSLDDSDDSEPVQKNEEDIWNGII